MTPAPDFSRNSLTSLAVISAILCFLQIYFIKLRGRAEPRPLGVCLIFSGHRALTNLKD